MDNQTFEEEGELDVTDTSENEESYSDDTDTSDEDDSTENSTDFLSKAKEITGREFKDEEDFKKHYKNLSSYVGKKVNTKVEPKDTKSDSKATISDDRVAELEFKIDNPELKEHFDVIKMVAREKGKTYGEILDDPLVKELLEVRMSKKGESIIHKNNKISSSDNAKKAKNVNTEDGLANYLLGMLEE